ncbi:MAG: glycosyltransferase family 4 protein, partial [Thermosphaera sp.]
MQVVFPYPLDFRLFPDIYEYINILQRRGVDAKYIGWSLKGESIISFVKSIVNHIRTINPDIVHVFHFRGSGLLPLIVKNKRIKWVIDIRTVHVQSSRFQTDRYFKVKDRVTWLEAQMYNYIFVLDSYLKSKFQPSLRPMAIVPLGGSWERFDPRMRDGIRSQVRAELGVPGDAVVLLYSGSLSPTRRVDVIVEAFARACRLWARDNVRMIIAGGVRGNAEMSKKAINELISLAQAEGIGEKVVFTGHRPYDEACQFYHAADIGISYLPPQSAYAYQPPTKIIEYMMAGLLVVSNKTPGV